MLDYRKFGEKVQAALVKTAGDCTGTDDLFKLNDFTVTWSPGQKKYICNIPDVAKLEMYFYSNSTVLSTESNGKKLMFKIVFSPHATSEFEAAGKETATINWLEVFAHPDNSGVPIDPSEVKNTLLDLYRTLKFKMVDGPRAFNPNKTRWGEWNCTFQNMNQSDAFDYLLEIKDNLKRKISGGHVTFRLGKGFRAYYYLCWDCHALLTRAEMTDPYNKTKCGQCKRYYEDRMTGGKRKPTPGASSSTDFLDPDTAF